MNEGLNPDLIIEKRPFPDSRKSFNYAAVSLIWGALGGCFKMIIYYDTGFRCLKKSAYYMLTIIAFRVHTKIHRLFSGV